MLVNVILFLKNIDLFEISPSKNFFYAVLIPHFSHVTILISTINSSLLCDNMANKSLNLHAMCLQVITLFPFLLSHFTFSTPTFPPSSTWATPSPYSFLLAPPLYSTPIFAQTCHPTQPSLYVLVHHSSLTAPSPHHINNKTHTNKIHALNSQNHKSSDRANK